MSSIAKLCSFNSICKKGSECKFSHIQGVCTFCLQGKCNKKDCPGKSVQVVDQSKGIYSFNNQQFSFHSISAKKEDEKKSVVSPLTVGKTAKTSSKKKFVKKTRYSDILKKKLGEAMVECSMGKPQKLIDLNKKIMKAKLGLTKELDAISSLHELVKSNLPKQDVASKLSEIDLAAEDDLSSSDDEEAQDV